MKRWFSLALLALVPTALAFAATVEDHGFDPDGLRLALMGAMRGYYSSPSVPGAVRKLPAEQRVAVVQTLAAFARAYFESPDFKKAYDEARKGSKPRRFGLPSISVDALKQKAVDKATGKDKLDAERTLDKDPKAQLKKRLQAFLDVTADVDYGAELNGRTFAREDYEAKPPEWKMCFRAGKETGEAIRKVAADWIAELP